MKHLYVLDTDSKEELEEFWKRAAKWSNDGMDVPERRAHYAGRAAIQFSIERYGGCCGLAILYEPHVYMEFLSNAHIRAVRNTETPPDAPNWPFIPTLFTFQVPTEDRGERGVMIDPHYQTNKKLFKTTKSLYEGIVERLSGDCFRKGGFLISDFAGGEGHLFKFVNFLLPSLTQFVFEPATIAFHNGNTKRKLATWFLRNRATDEHRNPEAASLEDVAKPVEIKKEQEVGHSVQE